MRTVKLSELFDIKYGTNLELNACEQDENGINFVSRTAKNNGVSAKIKRNNKKEPIPAGTISVALGGTVLEAFVQPKEYYTGRDIAYLTPKKEMTLNEKLYYCICIKANKYKYSYGRQANKTLPDLQVPAVIPDWVYEVEEPDLSEYKESFNSNKTPELNINEWQEFKISDLFEIKGSKTTKRIDLVEEGEYPYITTKSTNNGVDGYSNIWTEKGNILTIDSACVGTCFYQEHNFAATDHVEKLIPKFEMNKYNGLFIATIINKSNFKFSYGRGRCKTRIAKETIKLPVTDTGEPDYEFMESYIKTLKFSIIEQAKKTLENF